MCLAQRFCFKLFQKNSMGDPGNSINSQNKCILFWNFVPNSELTKNRHGMSTVTSKSTEFGQRTIVAMVTLSVHFCVQYRVNTMTAAQCVARVRLRQLRPVCLTDIFGLKLTLGSAMIASIAVGLGLPNFYNYDTISSVIQPTLAI